MTVTLTVNIVAVRQIDVVNVSVYTVTVRVTVYTVAVWQCGRIAVIVTVCTTTV